MMRLLITLLFLVLGMVQAAAQQPNSTITVQLPAATTTALAPPTASCANLGWNNGWICGGNSQGGGQTVPTGNVTFYVGPTGNDSTGDGSQGNPFATPQHAFDVLFANYDLQCKYSATVQLAAAPSGQYNFYPGVNISGRISGQCGTLKPLTTSPGLPPFVIGKYLPLTLQGDPNNPLGAFIDPAAGGGACLSLSDGAALRVTGIACDTSKSGQDGFDVFSNSFLDMSNVWFGNAGMPGSTYANHISVGFDSSLLITGNYGMSGSALAHIDAAKSTVDYENNGNPGAPIIVTIQNTPSFPAGFFLIDDSLAYVQTVQFSGVATGPGATVLRNGVLETNGHCGPPYLPGSAPAISEGGICH